MQSRREPVHADWREAVHTPGLRQVALRDLGDYPGNGKEQLPVLGIAADHDVHCGAGAGSDPFDGAAGNDVAVD